MPFLHEGGACVHAMIRAPSENDRDHHQCGYVRDEGKCLTCNMLCIRRVGDVDDHVDGDVVVIDVGFVVVPDMEEGSKHRCLRNMDPRSIPLLLARYS